MKDIKVSIVTVCYNSEKTIERAIKSVLEQTYSNIEYIIIDGASTDKTVEIIQSFEEQFEGRLSYLSEPDKGLYYAMNKGIERATGELIGIINSDDYYETDAVEKMVEAYGTEKYQILYGMIRSLREGKEDWVGLYSHHFLEQRMFCHPACFVTKSVYRDFGMFDTQYISAADYDFMLRMYRHKEIAFHPVYHIISVYEQGGFSATKKGQLDKLKLLKNYGKLSKIRYVLCRFRILSGI